MNLDVNFNNMSRRKALEKYVICINKLQEDAIRNHINEKCNTMQCARILKRLIPRPIDIPKEMSMGITRYLLFDTKDSQAYRIPDGDCDLSFARQVIGSRTFVLRPHPECGDICKKLTINLTEKHILFFNWWYYESISLPQYHSNSITYVGSYC
uniref:CSON013757 protein n=1 Tax=Culicoides sonorensis TaxID=179676 RepID=A0A336MKX0_CULSO